MAFQPIRRILPEAIRQAGIDEQVSSVRILSLTKETVERFWGREKAAYIEWISWKDGVIRIKTLSPVALQEMRMWEVRILNEVNRLIGSKKVLKIVGG